MSAASTPITPSFTSSTPLGRKTPTSPTSTAVPQTPFNKGSITPRTPTTNSVTDSHDSSPGGIKGLFSVAFISGVAAGALLFFILIMVFVCWSIRRKRTANLTNRSRRPIKQGNSEQEGLYAVTNLQGGRYQGIPGNQRNNTPEASGSSVEIIISSEGPTDPVPVPAGDQGTVYAHYLIPIDGPAEYRLRSNSSEQVNESDYLQPLHGTPTPDRTPHKSPKIAPKPRQHKLSKSSTSALTVPDIENTLYDEVTPKKN